MGLLNGLRTLVLVLLPVICLVAALEGFARFIEIWRPPMTEDIGQGFTNESRLFVPSDDDPATIITNPRKTVSFKEQSFAARKPAGVFRIFALGGSSVNYLDFEFPLLADRLTRVLPGVRRAEILNCGGLSYGSHRLVLIASEVMQYEPDLVLFYEAHNEFEEVEQLHLANLTLAPVQSVLTHSALYRFLRDRIAERRIKELKEARASRRIAETLPDTSRTWGHVFSPEERKERMDRFRANIERIVQICRDAGVPLILGTVPSNLIRPSLQGQAGHDYERVLELFKNGHYQEGRSLAQSILAEATRHQASDLENGIIREVAAALSVPLADVEAAVIAAEPHGIPGETLFNDHCHLNPEGNKILIRTYESEIMRLFSEKK